MVSWMARPPYLRSTIYIRQFLVSVARRNRVIFCERAHTRTDRHTEAAHKKLRSSRYALNENCSEAQANARNVLKKELQIKFRISLTSAAAAATVSIIFELPLKIVREIIRPNDDDIVVVVHNILHLGFDSDMNYYHLLYMAL